MRHRRILGNHFGRIRFGLDLKVFDFDTQRRLEAFRGLDAALTCQLDLMLKALVPSHGKQGFQQGDPIGVLRLQQLAELPLGKHDDLSELLRAQAEDAVNGFIAGFDRGLQRAASAALATSLVFWRLKAC